MHWAFRHLRGYGRTVRVRKGFAVAAWLAVPGEVLDLRTVDALVNRHDLLIVDNLPAPSGLPKPDASPHRLATAEAEAS
jgi:hypothetical protein